MNPRYRKTYAAALAALTLTVSLVWDLSVSAEEAIALISGWGGVFSVYAFPNDAPDGLADPAVSERGQANLAAVAWVLVIVFLVVLLARTL